jgi:hypothetical protein
MVLARRLAWVVLGVLALSGTRGPAAESTVSARNLASEARLRRDITYLAADAREGRGPTTAGLLQAGEYIASQFKQAGLKPGGLGGSYFQPFQIPGTLLEAPARLSLSGPQGQKVTLKQGEQFWPMGLAAAGKDAAAPLVFAGYGITSEATGYDDYAGLEVADKVVVLVRGSPHTGDRDKDRTLQNGAPFTSKLRNAEKHHAAAVLFVNDRDTAGTGDGLLDFNFTALDRPAQTKLPAFHVRRSVAQTLLASRGEDLEEIERGIDREGRPHSLDLPGWKADLEVKMHRDKITLRNVVGVMEGAGPLAKETVVVGAHYDHLGNGGVSSLSPSRKMAIHHGADDNGSGTTSLMELARRFGAMPNRQGRRLVFIAFSGEELGLFGSLHYCKEPLFPLADTAAMYNLDMVGRLRKDDKTGKEKLLTEGSGTAKPFLPLVQELSAKYDLQTVNKPGGLGPSDHMSFCLKRIPVLFIWTGYHDDYHRPSDTADKINVPGMRKLVDFSEEAVVQLTTMDRPEYVAVKERTGLTYAGGPRLGIRPEYADEGEGVLLGGVTPGEPAERAGLKKDDRIVAIAGKPVKDLQTYMEILQGQKKGDTIEVVVLRQGKRMPFKVKLD